MADTASELGALARAVAFAADKHRNQRRKDASVVLEVTDDKSLEKHIRKQRQIEHSPHMSTEAKLVKLADKICNLRDILASPPASWSLERKLTYFNWAAQVIAGVRGVHPQLEAVFDGLHAHGVEVFQGKQTQGV